MKRFLIILIAQYFLFPFYFDGISITIQQLITFGLMTLYVFLNFNFYKISLLQLIKRSRSFGLSLSLYATVFISTILVPILYGTNEFSLTYVHIRYMLYSMMYIILVVMIYRELKPDNLFKETITIFITATRNYVIISLVMILFPTLKNSWISIIHLQPRTLELINHPSYLTRVGWVGYSGFSITVYCSIAVIFSMYLFSDKLKRNESLPLGLLINLVLVLLGNTLYGRAGLLISLFSFALTLIYILVKYRMFKLAFILTLTAFVLFVLTFLLKEFIPALENWYEWMMQPFRSLLESGTIQTSSTDTLWEMWFIPNWKTILLGNGYYTSPLHFSNYYMATDVGYLRSILFFGALLSTFFYLIPITLITPFFKNDGIEFLFAITLLISIYTLEVKAETLVLLLPILWMLVVSKELNDFYGGYIRNEKRINRFAYN